MNGADVALFLIFLVISFALTTWIAVNWSEWKW